MAARYRADHIGSLLATQRNCLQARGSANERRHNCARWKTSTSCE